MAIILFLSIRYFVAITKKKDIHIVVLVFNAFLFILYPVFYFAFPAKITSSNYRLIELLTSNAAFVLCIINLVIAIRTPSIEPTLVESTESDVNLIQ